MLGSTWSLTSVRALTSDAVVSTPVDVASGPGTASSGVVGPQGQSWSRRHHHRLGRRTDRLAVAVTRVGLGAVSRLRSGCTRRQADTSRRPSDACADRDRVALAWVESSPRTLSKVSEPVSMATVPSPGIGSSSSWDDGPVADHPRRRHLHRHRWGRRTRRPGLHRPAGPGFAIHPLSQP